MMRPRDIILFFNLCIQQAVDRPHLTVDMLRKAEGEYSRDRLRSLADEWFADYPNLMRFIPLFRERPKVFSAEDITNEQCVDFCLDFAIQPPPNNDELAASVNNVVDDLISPAEFRRVIIQIFFRIGFIGLKLENSESVRWSLTGRTSVSRSEISDTTRITVHPAFWRVTGVIDRS